MDSDSEQLLPKDTESNEIREQISQMSFEELQKLKEELGTKEYNAAVFGKNKIKTKSTEFKRENKNRPREMSSKKPVSFFREIMSTQKNAPRDPRFDSLCGTFNEKVFKASYSFLTDVKKNDLKKLKKELKTEENPKVIKKIKYLIQRIENQLREETRLNLKKQKQNEDKKEIIKSIKEGKKPLFKKNSEKKMMDLVAQYEDLKSTGKLAKHIEKAKNKIFSKDRRKFNESVNIR